MLLLKKKAAAKGNRVLISISVLGSSGPIRLVVNEGDLVAAVIQAAVKVYARQGRLPVLGTDLDKFMLFCPSAFTGALSPSVTIGSVGFRNFTLCKKPAELEKSVSTTIKSSRIWKAWFSKSINLKVSSY